MKVEKKFKEGVGKKTDHSGKRNMRENSGKRGGREIKGRRERINLNGMFRKSLCRDVLSAP